MNIIKCYQYFPSHPGTLTLLFPQTTYSISSGSNDSSFTKSLNTHFLYSIMLSIFIHTKTTVLLLVFGLSLPSQPPMNLTNIKFIFLKYL